MALRQLTSVDAALGWFAQRGVRALRTDSRQVTPGDAFIAWPGHTSDGRRFVAQALASGANACLIEAQGVEAFAFDEHAPVAAMPGLKAVTGPLASAFMASPSQALQVVACTGTNGKTSTAWWVAQALSALGQRCGVVGTLGVGEPPSPSRPDASITSTGLTTPDAVALQTAFRSFVNEGFAACAVEASSIGIADHRLTGTHIKVALLTNFTQDHLDYHGSMAAYWATKARLFAWPGLEVAVVNVDDPQGSALAETLRAGDLDLWTYSASGGARLRASAIRYVGGGLCFDLVEGDGTARVTTHLIGGYNVSNLLAVVGALRGLGVSLADAARVCATLTPVIGRMQRVDSDGDAANPEVIVDYAHTPDALEKALLALRPFAEERGGRLWCVFGCGGNRDAAKRPLMGALAERLADQVVVTSDNPRNETPAQIIAQIIAATGGAVRVIENRAEAIAWAVREADINDVVLVAGKGHEDYQEIGGVRTPFSDVGHAAAALQRRSAAR